jgi:hypothetical protein
MPFHPFHFIMGSESEKSNQNSQPQDPTSSELYIFKGKALGPAL